MNPQVGSYGCVPSHSTTGWIIEHGTASPYGHAFIVLPQGRVFEARPSGVGSASLERYVKMGAVFNDQEPLASDFQTGLTAWALAHEGAGYDWPAILSLAARFFGEKSPLLPVGTHGLFICSQFVSVGYTALGKILFPELDRWTVSPRTLADRIMARPWEKAA